MEMMLNGENVADSSSHSFSSLVIQWPSQLFPGGEEEELSTCQHFECLTA